jgi:tetratricopeptide (TPR) repeat protein
MVLQAENTDLNAALQHALRAVALEPGDLQYLLHAGSILMQMNRFEDAQKIGERALAQARDDLQKQAAQQFLNSARRAAEWQRSPAAPEGDATGVASRPATPVTAPASTTPAATDKPSGPAMKFEGKVAEASCDRAILYLTLEGAKGSRRLRALDYTKLDYMAYKWEPPPNFSPCRDLKGHLIRATYQKLGEDASRGELLTIEVLE